MDGRYGTLERIYAKLPTLDCKRECASSCHTGPIRIGRLEWERIVERLGFAPVGNPDTMDCPLLEDGACTVYDIRPLICRLWGSTKRMRCSHGCEPKLWVGQSYADSLLKEVYEDGISYDMWSETSYTNAKKGMITMGIQEQIKEKIAEYHNAYMEALASANANNGAKMAMELLLADVIKGSEPKAIEPAKKP